MSAAAAAEILTKSDFAALISRHPAFITRAIEQGKLSGAALVGEGRGTRIRVAEALRQLAIKLDLGQQLAQSAPITPRLIAPALADPAAATEADPLAAERAEQVRLRNDKLRAEIDRGAREDAVAAGQLVDAQAVTRALSRQLAPMFNLFDELPAAIAKPLSEEFGLDYPRVLIAVKQSIRHQRSAWADHHATIARAGAAQVTA